MKRTESTSSAQVLKKTRPEEFDLVILGVVRARPSLRGLRGANVIVSTGDGFAIDMAEETRISRFRQETLVLRIFTAIILVFVFLIAAAAAEAVAQSTNRRAIAVGPQYDTTHVYLAQGDLDAFVKSFIATFGGSTTKPIVANVTPVPSNTISQVVRTPVGVLSIFAYQTPIPFPFGKERTGNLVNEMDEAIQAARAAGAEILVAPFKDPIGEDAIIQWPGGVKMQLYWHFNSSASPPLETVPDSRVYVSTDQADNFVKCFIAFSDGKMVSDDKHADAGEIGRVGETYRRIRITSLFGNMQVLVTDGHLPYPFGYELTGYQVQDLRATLDKAKTAGVKILSAIYTTDDRTSTIVEFPGNYIAEIHCLTVH